VTHEDRKYFLSKRATGNSVLSRDDTVVDDSMNRKRLSSSWSGYMASFFEMTFGYKIVCKHESCYLMSEGKTLECVVMIALRIRRDQRNSL